MSDDERRTDWLFWFLVSLSLAVVLGFALNQLLT